MSNHGRDDAFLCQYHFNGNDDEVVPSDYLRQDHQWGKQCIVCRANEMSREYGLWQPEYQRKMIVKTAARTKAFFAISGENNHYVTDPSKDFVQFLKDITYAMVGNKKCEHSEILMKALSHFGTVRVPRDRVKQIFTWKRGKQYTVIREEFQLETEQGTHQRYAYRVSKDYGNVFYKDYLKMVLGNDFAEIMDYPDPAAEKCGDVVEMSLGMLDVANMTKSQITFMETKADPGELLAGLEAPLNIFHGTTRSTTTSNTKRSGSRVTEPMNHEEVVVNKILFDTPMWHSLQNVCLIEDEEINIIAANYKRSMANEDDDDEMELDGQGTGAGSSAAPGPSTKSAGASAEGAGTSAAPDMHDAPGTPPNPEEEFQISKDKGSVIDAIDALFALADDNNVCLKCRESGHPNYECTVKGDDPVKNSLINLRKKLQGEEVDDEGTAKESKGEEHHQQQQQLQGYKVTRLQGHKRLRVHVPPTYPTIGDR